MRESDFLTAHFGLTIPAFSTLPDPSFLFWADSHKRAWAMLDYSLASGAPLTLLTGDIGTGKTLLLRHLLENLDDDVTAGLVRQTQGPWQDVLPWVLQCFGLESDPAQGHVHMFDRLQTFLIEEYAAGRRVLLIFDEAQNLSDAALEELRMLTNINTGPDCLVQLMLCGRSELAQRLRQPEMRAIAQRVAVACELSPLSAAEIAPYIQHRVSVAGGAEDLFPAASIETIQHGSEGVPRLVNQLCDLALLAAFEDTQTQVAPGYVQDVLADPAFFGRYTRPSQNARPSDMRSAS